MTYCLVFWEKKKSLQLQANLHSKSRPPPQVLIKSEDRTMKNMLIYRKLKKKNPSSEQKTVTATKHNC